MIAYNREAIINACLAPLSFADEVIVVDKSSTDRTAEIAARYCDRLITVPWTPVVEDTRAFALAQCRNEWILCLDDDECLSQEAAAFIKQELQAPRADIYGIAQRHWILGVHDERSYYWPEFQPRLFRRGAVSFVRTVHGGYVFHSDRRYDILPEHGVCVQHLSYRNVAEWIAKTNRYTSMADRIRAEHAGNDLAGFAHARIDYWRGRTSDDAVDGYPIAVALLRAVYDIVDRLKAWEEEEGLDGEKAFREFVSRTTGTTSPATAADQGAHSPPSMIPARDDAIAALRDALRSVRAMAERMQDTNDQRIASLKQHIDELESALAAERLSVQRTEACLETERSRANEADALAARRAEAEAETAQANTDLRQALNEAAARRRDAERRSADVTQRLDLIEASTIWRTTRPLRAVGHRYPLLRQGLRRGLRLIWSTVTLQRNRRSRM
ncbi:MAG TPA: glycosyltransferase family 2 protein [Rhodopila sp.]|uniref:glycosyltransferase family 2 protein n=1 Tax=Rhodopila sp. TaxID=2480087 RepID=UPI002CD4DBA4|nr:glycosyltransferase family 2 protein [Rhodopila sp.]HVY14129.1 glycosyltransferase family 2 protein [Rhodopila sp.]